MKLNNILIIDDDAEFRKLLQVILEKISPSSSIEQYDPVYEGSPGRGFDWSNYELLLLDQELGEGEYGLDWLHKFKKDESFPATIMLTAHGSEEIAVRALRFGAQEYINKQKLSKNRLEEAIKNAMEKQLLGTVSINTSVLKTTVFNKEYFYKTLGQMITDEQAEGFSFLIQLWVDDYQYFYEKLGLLVADQLVSKTAADVAKLLDDDKYHINITRIGDSAIGCLVSGLSSLEAGEKIASHLCRKLTDKSGLYDKENIPFSVSIGVVNISRNLDSLDKLLLSVDQACRTAKKETATGNSFCIYTDKRAGPDAKAEARPKNTFFIYTDTQTKPEVRETSPEKNKADTKPVKRAVKENTGTEKTLQLNVQDIIKQNRLQLYFQPLIAMSETASMFDAEFMQLRLRLIDEQGSILNPDDLKDEDFNKNDRVLLDRWLIRNALGKLLSVSKDKQSFQYGLVMPLSSESLTTTAINDWMNKLVLVSKSSNIASTTIFEIRPMHYLSNKDSANAIMNLMRDKWGVSFALSSVINGKILKTCLQLGSFEFIKIPLIKEKFDAVQEISKFSGELGSLIILENIEDEECLVYAAKANSDYAIGDYIQPPQDDLVVRQS